MDGILFLPRHKPLYGIIIEERELRGRMEWWL